MPQTSVRAALRVVARLTAVAAVLVTAVATVALLPGRYRSGWLRTCSRAMLRAAGVRLLVSGPTWQGGLVVANHLSWIDVLAVSAVAPVRLVAKREVRGWPLVGGVARRAGTVFVDRRDLRSLPATVAGLADVLRAGTAVAVFPEGTTWCGAAAGPFRRASFQAALAAGVPVWPVAIGYREPGGDATRRAAFVGVQTLFDSMLRVVSVPGLVCELTVLPPLVPTGARRELARRAQDAITAVTRVRHDQLAVAVRAAGLVD